MPGRARRVALLFDVDSERVSVDCPGALMFFTEMGPVFAHVPARR